MPFLSCLPCFKDKETRHSTEDELEKPIPVEKIVNNSNGSAAKPTTNFTTTSDAVTFSSDKRQEANDQSTSTQAVTYTTDKKDQSNDKSTSTQVVNLASEDPDTNNAVTFSDEKLPEPNAGPVPESNVSALTNRETTASSEVLTEPNSSYATPAATMADSLTSAASGVTDTVSSGAQQAQSAASSGAQQAQSAASTGSEKVTGAASGNTSGTEDWHAMSDDQKKTAFDALPEGSEQKKMGYYEWVKSGLYNKKENWMPWIEDQYLRWFTGDNKASYATKDAMDKSKVTGIEQVDTLQDSVNSTVAGQVGQGGLLQPVGDAVSKEGVNRAERGGKDDGGSYMGSAGNMVSGAGGSVWGGAKSAGGYVGGMFSGKKDDAGSATK